MKYIMEFELGEKSLYQVHQSLYQIFQNIIRTYLEELK